MKILIQNILPGIAKLLLAIIIMVVSMAFFIASINEAMAATPKRHVTITTDHITLGDVFHDIKDNSNYVLAPAPRPDVTLTWDAFTLNRIAKAFDLQWRANALDQITIRRLGNIVTEKMLEDAILRSFGGDNNMDLEFVGADTEIILPHDIEPTLTIVTSSYNESRQTFSATLRTADDKVRNLSGISHQLITLPVLKTPVRRGDTITRNMVKQISIRENYVTNNMVLNTEKLVGMTPRKILRANVPVTFQQLDKPTMIKRGDLVTMQLKHGPINITALAKAMESGTDGDIIRLMNVDSKRTLEAEVTGLREARVF